MFKLLPKSIDGNDFHLKSIIPLERLMAFVVFLKVIRLHWDYLFAWAEASFSLSERWMARVGEMYLWQCNHFSYCRINWPIWRSPDDLAFLSPWTNSHLDQIPTIMAVKQLFGKDRCPEIKMKKSHIKLKTFITKLQRCILIKLRVFGNTSWFPFKREWKCINT